MEHEKWNKMKPAERLKFIENLEKTTGEKIGHYNAKVTFFHITNPFLIESILEHEEETFSPVENAKKILDEAIEDEISKKEIARPKSLDLCISFDDTGSMATVRSLVRNNIVQLINDLKKSVPELRIAVIIHNDYCDHPEEIYTQNFTTDYQKIVGFVHRDSPCGGGDSPECYELALHEATLFDWKSDARIMIMIGDEIPHEMGYSCRAWRCNKSIFCQHSWRNEVSTLAKKGVSIYGIQALNRYRSASFYETISKNTNGIKLDLSQFQNIMTYINAIVYKQTGDLDEYYESQEVFSTNYSLKNMFDKLRGKTVEHERIDLDALSSFQVLNVDTDGNTSIRDFVESNHLTFKKGRGFYQLIPRTADGKANFEIIQADKEVVFVDKITGEVNRDTVSCRNLLGIPWGTKGKIHSGEMSKVIDRYDVFIQSNSYNRKLDPGTKFLYELESM